MCLLSGIKQPAAEPTNIQQTSRHHFFINWPHGNKGPNYRIIQASGYLHAKFFVPLIPSGGLQHHNISHHPTPRIYQYLKLPTAPKQLGVIKPSHKAQFSTVLIHPFTSIVNPCISSRSSDACTLYGPTDKTSHRTRKFIVHMGTIPPGHICNNNIS